MSDLISRKALHEAISYALYSSIKLDVSDIRDIINNQLTAYDVDKVVEQLEGLKSNLGFGGTIQTLHADGNICKAVEIVKGGGVDEN